MSPSGAVSPWARRVHALLSGQREPGVYRLVTSAGPEQVVNAARAAGWSTWTVTTVPTTKAELLAALAQTMTFPDWFGGNWDALGDCLTDITTDAAGGLLVWADAESMAEASPTDWTVARSVLERAVAYHREHGWSFAVVCLGERTPRELDRL